MIQTEYAENDPQIAQITLMVRRPGERVGFKESE